MYVITCTKFELQQITIHQENTACNFALPCDLEISSRLLTNWYERCIQSSYRGAELDRIHIHSNTPRESTCWSVCHKPINSHYDIDPHDFSGKLKMSRKTSHANVTMPESGIILINMMSSGIRFEHSKSINSCLINNHKCQDQDNGRFMGKTAVDDKRVIIGGGAAHSHKSLVRLLPLQSGTVCTEG